MGEGGGGNKEAGGRRHRKDSRGWEQGREQGRAGRSPCSGPLLLKRTHCPSGGREVLPQLQSEQSFVRGGAHASMGHLVSGAEQGSWSCR